jgi:hypothetical protein
MKSLSVRALDASANFWLGLGAVGGAAASLFCYALANALVPDANGSLANGLSNWQTLIAGLLALAGAIATVVAVRRQIEAGHHQEEERRIRQLTAARAVMPLALVKLIEYTDASLGALKAMNGPPEDKVIVHPQGWTPPVMPEIPETAVEVLRNCLQFSDAPAMEAICDIISEFQICNSRLRATIQGVSSGGGVVRHGYNQRIAENLALGVRFEKLFDYARRKTGHVDSDIVPVAVLKKAILVGLYDCGYPGLADEIKSKYGSF